MGAIHFLYFALLMGSALADNQDIRLPTQFVPSAVSLDLTFDDSSAYSGDVTIVGTFLNIDKNIVLHADLNYLKIKNVRVSKLKSGVWTGVSVASHGPCTENQFYGLTLQETPKQDVEYRLYINFTHTSIGSLNDKSGMFKASASGYEVIGTSFYPIQARTAFPCFDEPSFLSNYTVTLTYNSKYTLYGNTKSSSSSAADNNTTTTTLVTTHPLASHQLGFYLVTGFSQPKNPSERTYVVAQETTVLGDLLMKYTNTSLFDIWRNDLPIITVILVPEMNGRILTSYNLIVMDSYYAKDSTKLSAEQSISLITRILSSVARQIFGSRLSIYWWDDAWILESFPIFLANSIIEKDSNWKSLYENLKAKSLPSILELQGPVLKNVATSDDILESINSKSNYKGASILSMFDYLMEDGKKMVDVAEKILEIREGEVINTQYFLAAFSSLLSGNMVQQAGELAKWWSNQCTPVIRVHLNSIEQLPLSSDCQFDEQTPIPVTFVSSNNNSEQFSMISPSQPYSFNDVSWIIANTAANGMYRVQYEQYAANALMNSISSKSVTPLQRAQAISDAFWGAFSDSLSFYNTLSLTNYMNNEADLAPWAVVAEIYKKLDKYMAFDETVHKEFQERVLEEITDKFEDIIDFDNPSSSFATLTLNESIIVSLACDMNLQDCLNDAKNVFNTPSPSVSQNISSTVNCAGIGKWDQTTWNETYCKWVASARGNPFLWESVLDQLACNSDPDNMLNYVFEKSLEDLNDLYSSILKRSEHVTDALGWFISNYGNLPNKTLCSMIKSSGDAIVSEDQLNKFAALKVKDTEKECFNDAKSISDETVSFVKYMLYNWERWIKGSSGVELEAPKIQAGRIIKRSSPLRSIDLKSSSNSLDSITVGPGAGSTGESSTSSGSSTSEASTSSGSSTSEASTSSGSSTSEASTSSGSSTSEASTSSVTTTIVPSTTSKPGRASGTTLSLLVLLAPLALAHYHFL